MGPEAGEYLKCMFSAVPPVDPYRDAAYVGGAFQPLLMMGWSALISGKGNVPGRKRDQ